MVEILVIHLSLTSRLEAKVKCVSNMFGVTKQMQQKKT